MGNSVAVETAKEVVEQIHEEFWENRGEEVDSQLVLAEQFGACEIDEDLSSGFVNIFEQRVASYGTLGAVGAVFLDGILIGRELERRGIGGNINGG